MTSLVRQRLDLEGRRSGGRWLVVAGGLLLVLTVLVIADGRNGGLVVMPTILLVTGFRQLRKSRRDLAAFEAEHGVGAGVQQPIR